jgi:hypothetical protein
MHSQCILGQRMDILFDALADAPTRTRCPTCGQRFTRSTTSMENQARQWSEVFRLLFFVNSSCRINFLVYYRNRLEGHTIFPYTVYVVLFIAVLSIAGLRGHPNIVHTFLFTQIGCIILFKQFCSNNSSIQDDVSNSEHLRATCSGFPSVAE